MDASLQALADSLRGQPGRAVTAGELASAVVTIGRAMLSLEQHSGSKVQAAEAAIAELKALTPPPPKP